MTTLIAKPVINGQFWIITDGVEKVGNVQSDGKGYELKLNGVSYHYNSTTEISSDIKINFLSDSTKSTSNEVVFSKYPTTGETYNNIYDVRRKLHLYTKTMDSKCYYAAGYFAIHMNDVWQIVHCPKYIYIQRYEYHGPFHSFDEANSMINT